MKNPFTDCKTSLSTFCYDEQINEKNQKIYELVNKKQPGNIKDTRYERIKELKHMKNNIINIIMYH